MKCPLFTRYDIGMSNSQGRFKNQVLLCLTPVMNEGDLLGRHSVNDTHTHTHAHIRTLTDKHNENFQKPNYAAM